MANRRNHYEAAFESYLRSRSIPYIPSLETHRCCLSNGETLKNFDFIVSQPGHPSLLVDIKGRLFPGGQNHKSYWKQWTTQDDLTGLKLWESILGPEFQGYFVFAYLVTGNRSPVPPSQLFRFRKRDYAFIGIKLDDYLKEARMISPRWQTLSVPAPKFKILAKSFDDLY